MKTAYREKTEKKTKRRKIKVLQFKVYKHKRTESVRTVEVEKASLENFLNLSVWIKDGKDKENQIKVKLQRAQGECLATMSR